MPVEINDTDILMAEKILFGKTGIFSICEGDSDKVIFSKNQRVDFIKDLRTLDLRAVPGSGKTTALLAKLIILESKLPFDDGSGILVLSHTNAAVDEIKRKIEHHCPKLFHYPNFVGTIQSFVDQFLAIPFYKNSFLDSSLEIGDEIYSKAFCDLFYINLNCFKKKHGINDEYKDLLIRYFYIDRKRTYELYFGSTSKELIKKNGANPSFIIPEETKERKEKIGFYTFEEKEFFNVCYYEFVLNCKRNLLKHRGIISYRDAYSLSNIFLDKHESIIDYIQRRVNFVFVDEMQDMDKHQIDLLERLIYNDGKSKSIYQRIGDKNQAIHNDIETEDCWKDRIPTLEFTGSHRLNPYTANVVQPFGLYPMELHGLANSEVDFVKPHLIVYEDPKEVLPKFERLIKEKNLDQVKTNDKYPFRAIGWVGPHRTKKNGKKDVIDYEKHVIKTLVSIKKC